MKKREKIEILAIILPIILFILIVLFFEAGKATSIETSFYNETTEHMSPVITSIMKIITHMGDSLIVCLVGLGLFIIPHMKRKVAIPVSITIVTSAVLNVILKNFFARQRPDILRLMNETDYSFPSGHAMINMALYTMLALLVMKYIKNKTIKFLLLLYCITIPILIGISRVYLGVHYITDVIGGWSIGFAISLCIYMLWNKKILKAE